MKIKINIILIVLLCFFSEIIFSAETGVSTIPNSQTVQTTPSAAQNQQTEKPIKKTSNIKNTKYISIGANLLGIDQDVVDNASGVENDVKFFAADFVIDFQYLFRHLMININFEYSKFKTKMHFKDNAGNDYSLYKVYRKKIINATLGFAKEFSGKYLLVFPAVGFGYQDFDNPLRNSDYRCEMYYLILNSRFYINISKAFIIGFDMDFRIILSHIATLDYKHYGDSRVILRKGLFFSFRIPMNFNFSNTFYFSLVPWIQVLDFFQTEGILIDLDTGTKNQETFYKNKMFAGGLKLMFGVYF